MNNQKYDVGFAAAVVLGQAAKINGAPKKEVNLLFNACLVRAWVGLMSRGELVEQYSEEIVALAEALDGPLSQDVTFKECLVRVAILTESLKHLLRTFETAEKKASDLQVLIEYAQNSSFEFEACVDRVATEVESPNPENTAMQKTAEEMIGRYHKAADALLDYVDEEISSLQAMRVSFL